MNTNEFIILTRDCIGYKYYNFEYNSPTIGNCMNIPDFILFLENIDIIPHIKLQLIDDKYPIGILNIPNTQHSIKVHFIHDFNKQDILLKWSRRVTRMLHYMSYKKYLLLNAFNDCDLANIYNSLDFYIERFFNLSFGSKIFFCKYKTFKSINLPQHILDKGLIIILPDNCTDIINFINNNTKITNHIFSNKTGTLFI